MKKLFVLIAMLLAGTVAAQPYPSKSIRIIVPFTPGSATDVMARIVGERLNTAWGQPVIVENKPGAGGTIGIRDTARVLHVSPTTVIKELKKRNLPPTSESSGVQASVPGAGRGRALSR